MLLLNLDHVALAVHDLDEALDRFQRLYGVAPASREVIEADGVEEAMLLVGGSQVQLLAPLRPDSPVARFLARRGEGLHHLAFAVPDLDAALAHLVGRGGGAHRPGAAPRRGRGPHRLRPSPGLRRHAHRTGGDRMSPEAPRPPLRPGRRPEAEPISPEEVAAVLAAVKPSSRTRRRLPGPRSRRSPTPGRRRAGRGIRRLPAAGGRAVREGRGEPRYWTAGTGCPAPGRPAGRRRPAG